MESLCTCGHQDAQRYPDATDRVIVPTAGGCPIHDPKPSVTTIAARILRDHAETLRRLDRE